MLYPLKFKTIYRDKIWGGTRLLPLFGKDFSPLPNCGETWELSGVRDHVSVVGNGFLAGNELNELVEIYMGELVGEKVYDRFGNDFPLLVKLIDTNEFLSIQVHPGDEYALKKHQSAGKTEMWYVLNAEPGAEIICGFNRAVDQETYLRHLEQKSLREILNVEKAAPGDVFYIPAGRIHAIGAGITLVEIQQTSDVTYRVYDWDRQDEKGQYRDLHTDDALEVMDFNHYPAYKTDYTVSAKGSVNLVSSPYFTTNLISLSHKRETDYMFLDSFVILVCLEGSLQINYSGGSEHLKAGEVILIPAELKSLEFLPETSCKLLESYIQ